MAVRSCYICGQEAPRRLIAEPLLVPVCLKRQCGRRAAELPVAHCSTRLSDGQLCGQPAATHIAADDRLFCARHLQTEWDRHQIA